MALPDDLRDALVGEWAGDYTLWLQPDVVAQECPVTATFAPLLDDRFLVHTLRVVVRGRAAARARASAYNITPQGDEMKATEARYTKR